VGARIVTKLTLTFDNGPDPDATPAVLDALRVRGVRASFFVCGVGNDLHPALPAASPEGLRLLARIRDEGHWVGNHTLTHTVELGTTADAAQIAEEVGGNDDLLGDLNPDRLFRPYMAGGELGPRTFSPQAVRYLSENLYTVVLFNSCPRDWMQPDDWHRDALQAVADNDWTVMILHDVARYGGMRRLPRFLDEVADRGVQIVQEFAPDCVPIVRGEVRGDLTGLLCGETPQGPRPLSLAAIPTINRTAHTATSLRWKAEDIMNPADGTWNCVIKSPLGDRHTVLTVTTDGDRWTGSSQADDASIDCENGELDGDTITWTMRLTKPVPVVLECRATIDGDTLTGITKAGAFGSFAMNGTRAAVPAEPDAR
jgi:peptidoglycan-N-acetylglucosamine deacetylase